MDSAITDIAKNSEDELIDRIDAWLPQTQCTRCGYPRCRLYAEAVAHGEADINQCPPGGDTTLNALAAVLDVAAGVFNLGDALTPYPQPLNNAGLRTHGIYRYVRHPIYAGVIIAALGWALWWLSPAGVLYFCMVGLFFDRKVTFEERWLRRTYTEYSTYQKTVKKFIPWLY